MIANYPYKNINQVLAGIRTQIIDSVQYCYDNIPAMENPKELFYYLKERTRFKHDPENIELLQTAKTLFENNYHGIIGAGDCDCLVILSCACYIAQGWGNFDIVLAGRSHSAPVHIYTRIKNNDGYYDVFDLTEANYNQERKYPLKQILPVKFYAN